MAEARRQRALFAAEDFRVVYRAFREVNFTAYDFDSIRANMISYIRLNFPEDFNDWIESSEFVALIELLAYFGQSLAFRMDLNTRENFLDTAERRESILRLARLLSYQPTRNIPATGLLKITQISTNQPITDSNGQNLSNRTIRWNDPNNPDWMEQFILVLNNVFNDVNPFGQPLKEGSVGGINTQLYSLNNDAANSRPFPFSANVSGQLMSFELVNTDFTVNENFFERDPDPLDNLHIVYRNDGRGNDSPNTGFLMLFKQGTLSNEDFQIDVPQENRVINVSAANINNRDVFVHEVDQQGFIIDKWEQVPAITGNNIIFNSLESDQRQIYSLITRTQDRIAVRFADGRFGDVPVGTFRVWYRTSNGLRYRIRPEEVRNVGTSVSYFSGPNNQRYTANITFSLQEPVSNSSPTQSNQNIKDVAPQVYYTQNRMVNGEDYNVFPLQNPDAARIKAVNRIFSGQSRFIDVNDPSGQSQNVNMFANDGILYKQEDDKLSELALPSNLTNDQIVAQQIEPLLQELGRRHIYYFFYPITDATGTGFDPAGSTPITWQPSSLAVNSSTGNFQVNGANISIGPGSPDQLRADMSEGALILFQNAGWVSINSIFEDGTTILASGDGAVRLSEFVSEDDVVTQVLAPFRTVLTPTEELLIVGELTRNNSFGIRYEQSSQTWQIVSGENLDINSPFSLEFAGDQSGTQRDSSWLVRAEFSPTAWRFFARTLDYVFESDQEIRFFNFSGDPIIDPVTGRAAVDTIRVLNCNPTINTRSCTIGFGGGIEFFEETQNFPESINFVVDEAFVEPDGFVNTKRIKLTYPDADRDGVPDDPTIFNRATAFTPDNLVDELCNGVTDITEIFFEATTNTDGFVELDPTAKIRRAYNNVSDVDNDPNRNMSGGNWPANTRFNDEDVLPGEGIYIRNTGQFFVRPTTGDYFEATNQFRIERGRKNIDFQWKHFAPDSARIDPSVTNIIDIFVLSVNYDTEIRQWIDDDGELFEMPETPTTEDLRVSFSEILQAKMISDEVIFHPVRYKVLFGRQANEEVRATFKVTKVPGATLSDGEIKAQIVSIINEFFSINNFDFGETFYFTELSAFIHQRLATQVASVVIVPLDADLRFGGLFQVRSEPDEVFISAAKVSDIQIVSAFNDSILRIGN